MMDAKIVILPIRTERCGDGNIIKTMNEDGYVMRLLLAGQLLWKMCRLYRGLV